MTDLGLPVAPTCFLPWRLCTYLTSHPWIVYTIFWCALNGFWQSLTLIAQLYQISRNVTTNEEVNMSRYDYFFETDPVNPAKKRFANPFSHGFVKNWGDFCTESGANSKINFFELFEIPKRELDP